VGERGGEPPGVTVEETAAADGSRMLVVRVTWFQAMGVVGLLASLAMALPAVALGVGGEDGGMALIAAVPAALLFYWSLATVLNHATITLTDRWLTVRSGPIPWPHGFETALDRIERIELRELRAVRRGRTFVRGYDSVAIVRGLPERLSPGVTDRPRHTFVVETLTAAIAKRRAAAAPASPGSAAPIPSATPQTTATQSATTQPTAGARAPSENTAVLDRTVALLRPAGAADLDRFEALVRPLVPELAAPFCVALLDASPHPHLRATLPDSGKPAFGKLHLAHRPDDFRNRIWVRHMDQLLPLMQLGSPLRLRVGLRGGTTMPVTGLETRVDRDLAAAIALQPHLQAGAIAKLHEAFAGLSDRVVAIESRFDPPGLLMSLFWTTASVEVLDAAGARVGVIASHRQKLADALARGLVPTRVGVCAVQDGLLPELVIETVGEAGALASLVEAPGPAGKLLATPGLVTLRVRYHAETEPLVSVEREVL